MRECFYGCKKKKSTLIHSFTCFLISFLTTKFQTKRSLMFPTTIKCLSLSGYNSLPDHRTYSCPAHSYKSPWRPCLLYQCDLEWYLFPCLPWFYLTDWSLSLLAGRGAFGEAVEDSIFSPPANGLFPCSAMSLPMIRALCNWPRGDPFYLLPFPWQLSATSGHRSGARASVSDGTDTWGVE